MGEIIKMYFRKMRREVMDWILLAQVTVYWQAFVNTVMNFKVPQRRG
jgi:hypothetical protein